jgi:hypothetical protein
MAKNKFNAIAEQDARSVVEERLRVSFKYLDWDSDEFFFHGMEIKYYQKFFDCITTIESSTEREITEQTHPSLSPKSIFNSQTSIRDSFSDEVINKIKDKLFVQTRDEESSLDQANRDYRYKSSEYAARGIPEYWIVDPITQKVTVLEWVEGFYEEQVYENDNMIVSPLFADLKLTAAQVLQG